MKTFIIFIIIEILCEAKEMFINRNELNTIDTFQGFGVVLDANITNQSSNAHLCQIVKQKLTNLMQTEIKLTPFVDEEVFSLFYLNGSLKVETNHYYIVSMVPFQKGAVILFSDGRLIYIHEINGNIIKMESNEKIQIHPSQLIDPIHMFYFSTIQKIVIILQKIFIYVQINQNETNIFGIYTNQTDNKTLTTQNIEFVDEYLFILEQKEFIIYACNSEGLYQIFSKKLEMNFIDMKVQQQNDVYHIFFLHLLSGVEICVYDPILFKFQEISSYDMIPIKGFLIGLYEQILMIVDEDQSESIIYELHPINQTNKWMIFNKYKVKNIIYDIQFTDNYALLLGKNRHDILYHSLPTVDNQIHNQIIIPALQQIHLIDQTEPYDNKFIGITKHTYFVTNFSTAPQRIDCQYQEDSGPIQFSYYQNSTQCTKLPQKQEGQLCLYISNYTIYYKYPILTTEHYIYIQIVGFLFALVCAILIVFFFNKYFEYTELMIGKQNIDQQHLIDNPGGSNFNSVITSPQNVNSNSSKKKGFSSNLKSPSNLQSCDVTISQNKVEEQQSFAQ
ncbi:unnamed protein product (macronuclear) [Paramecium tetraurelia]|uniref:Transmembrane protein n=1 Tax=Paramecium tetraurelia TaxID=5888 RepID=A0DY02_PARTE|nr:uncharacterized protein GSPATT00021543001 [Paramecium tetraurelia]CAK87919.1 unnamed protein product [Paramecium tetraurelia]|eukprot:XP_001455316.1 hypothetical protein (macronuclear) [Paramecium tetraurelia strain d4-2]